jgi:hypothetical protein
VLRDRLLTGLRALKKRAAQQGWSITPGGCDWQKPEFVYTVIEQTRDVAAAMVRSLTEGELAHWRREQGYRVRAHCGRYWMESPRGFLQPLHWMARLSLKEASAPAVPAWGFRAVLADGEIGAANGALPVHVLTDVAGYGLQNLSSNRRNHLRRCYKRATIVELTGPALLRQQGYEVLQSALNRTGYARAGSKEHYLASLATYVTPGRRIVIAAVINGRLGGYLAGFAVDGTAYVEQVHLSTEALTDYVGIGLAVEFVRVCQRSEGIHEIIYGQHSREDEQLCTFKERIGFPVRRFPARVRVMQLVAQLLRWRYPHKYYRLTGQE